MSTNSDNYWFRKFKLLMHWQLKIDFAFLTPQKKWPKICPQPQNLPPRGVMPDDYREYFISLQIEICPQNLPPNLPPNKIYPQYVFLVVWWVSFLGVEFSKSAPKCKIRCFLVAATNLIKYVRELTIFLHSKMTLVMNGE